MRAPVILGQRASLSQASNKRGLVYPDRIGRKLSDSRRFWSNRAGFSLLPPAGRGLADGWFTLGLVFVTQP